VRHEVLSVSLITITIARPYGIFFKLRPGWIRCCWARRKSWGSAGGVSFRARTWRDRAGAEPAVSGALEVGKRVRTETELGTRPMSAAAAGVKLAERIFGKLSERKALVLARGR